jgi:hypothetical protein
VAYSLEEELMMDAILALGSARTACPTLFGKAFRLGKRSLLLRIFQQTFYFFLCKRSRSY